MVSTQVTRKDLWFSGHIVPNCLVFLYVVGTVDKVYMSSAYPICLSVLLSSLLSLCSWILCSLSSKGWDSTTMKIEFSIIQWGPFSWMAAISLHTTLHQGTTISTRSSPQRFVPVLIIELLPSSLALFSVSSSLQSRHNFRDLKESKIDENFFGIGWQGRSLYDSLTISCTCVAGLGREWKNSEADALQQQTACFPYIFWVQGCY